MNPAIKNLLLLVTVVVTVLLLSSFKVISVSYSQLDIARSSAAKGEFRRAVLAYERSIQAYLPLFSSHELASSELQELLQSLEQRNNQELALEGWQRLRAALFFSRSMFGQPDVDLLQEANQNIARLTAATDSQGIMTKEAIEQDALQLLGQHPRDIAGFWGVSQFMFLMLWIGLTSLLIWEWRGVQAGKRTGLLSASAVSWLGWLSSLYMAG